jgi:hypothetical protein
MTVGRIVSLKAAGRLMVTKNMKTLLKQGSCPDLSASAMGE